MKYAVFWVALSLMPVLALVLSLDRRLIRWALFGMLAGLFLDSASLKTSLCFFSHESYRGSSRGMEVTLIHLLALALVGAWAFRGKWQRLLPEGGIRLYVVYFLLCLPSLFNADSVLIGWLEVWKMLLLVLFWHAVYDYLAATGDAGTVVKALAVFAIANFVQVALQHYGGNYQPSGMFPTRIRWRWR